MLNTESKLGAFCIWSVIAAIFTIAAWSYFKIAAPADLWAQAIASEAASTLQRFQIFVGFALLAAALLLNGWRERRAFRGERESDEASLTQALRAELADLELDCTAKAREAWAFAEEIATGKAVNGADELLLPEGLFKAIAGPADTLLMDLAPEELSRMGPDLYVPVRRLRRQLRYVEDLIDAVPSSDDTTSEDQSAFFKDLAQSYLGLAHACHHMAGKCNGAAHCGGHRHTHHISASSEAQRALADMSAS